MVDKKKEHGLPEVEINKHLICFRKISKGCIVNSNGPKTPAIVQENPLVEILHKMADMNKALSVGESIELGNEFIVGTDLEEDHTTQEERQLTM